MFKVEFACEIGIKMTIKLTQVVGVVKGWMIDEDGVKIAWLQYADANKTVRAEWFREDELKAM